MTIDIPLYIQVLTGIGVLVLLTAWLPMVLRRLPLSLPILSVGVGALLFSLPELRPYATHPLEWPVATEHLTELIVILSLMGAGLKIDRVIGWKRWKLTWRLLGIGMPLTIGAVALLGSTLLGLGVATALLVGACMAPTDPVLAGDVQVGKPGEGEEDDARFTLTSEAGLNDGLAFPFVNLAIVLAASGAAGSALGEWALVDVLWKIVAGIASGYAIGRVLGYLTFHLPVRAKLAKTGDGFVVLGATLLSYGLTEIIHGYGFLAVFVAALGLRHAKRDHDYHTKLHDFADEIERLMMVLLLVVFGGMIAHGGVLGLVDWRVVAFAAVTLFVIRPLAGIVSLAGTRVPLGEKVAISFFGIRGLGSFYYLAYALNHAGFQDPRLLWSAMGLVVLVSILLHGTTVTPALRVLDHFRLRGERSAAAA